MDVTRMLMMDQNVSLKIVEAIIFVEATVLHALKVVTATAIGATLSQEDENGTLQLTPTPHTSGKCSPM